MLKFGKLSATTSVGSTDGSISRALIAALMPASLPPMMTRLFFIIVYLFHFSASENGPGDYYAAVFCLTLQDDLRMFSLAFR